MKPTYEWPCKHFWHAKQCLYSFRKFSVISSIVINPVYCKIPSSKQTKKTLRGDMDMIRMYFLYRFIQVFGIGKFYSFNLMDERLIKLIFRGALYSQYPQGWNCFARSSGQERGHPVCLVRQTGQVIWINNKHTFVFVDNQTCVLCYYRQNAKWREGRSQCERPRTYDKFYQKTPGNFQTLVRLKAFFALKILIYFNQ